MTPNTPDNIKAQIEKDNIIPGAGRRDPTPEGVANRALYGRYLSLKRTHELISLPEKELDEKTNIEITQLIQVHLNSIQNLDPGIPLEIWRRQENQKLQDPEYQYNEKSLATTKLDEPPLKHINDHLLGITRADAFFNDHHQETDREITPHLSRVFSIHFKGEHILIEDTSPENQHAIRGSVKNLEENIDPRLLQEHAEAQIQYLEKSKQEKLQIIAKEESKRMTKPEEYDAPLIEKQINQINQIEKNIEILKNELINVKPKVKIAFGSSPIKIEGHEISLKNLLLALLKSEICANESKGKKPENNENLLSFFNTGDFFESLLTQKLKLIHALKGPESARLREFFDINNHSYLPTLKVEKIVKLRKMEDYQKTEESQKNQDIINEFVLPHYAEVNKIDILKNFTRAKFAIYENYIKETADIITEANDISKNSSPKEKQELLKKMLPILSQACKSKSAGIETGLTHEEFIRRLTHDKIAIIIFGDIKNFGAENISDLENTENQMIDLLYDFLPQNMQEALKGNIESINEVLSSPKNIKNMLSASIPNFEKNENFEKFNDLILGIGDKCTNQGNTLREDTAKDLPHLLKSIMQNEYRNQNIDIKEKTIIINTPQGEKIYLNASLKEGYSIGNSGDETIVVIPIDNESETKSKETITESEGNSTFIEQTSGVMAFFARINQSRIAYYLNKNPDNEVKALTYLLLCPRAEADWKWLKTENVNTVYNYI